MVIEKFTCPCCGYKTFTQQPNETYDICQVCFWEDDSAAQSLLTLSNKPHKVTTGIFTYNGNPPSDRRPCRSPACVRKQL